MKTQKEMFYTAHGKTARLNTVFMDLVNDPANPMTNEDLKKLIEKRPEVYGRFAGFIGKLAN
jgi:hypothetical protein